MFARRLAVVLAVSALVAVAWPSVSAADGQARGPACVQVTASAPYDGTGYSHIVHIDNRCAAAAICSVSTDVNPTPVQTRVPAGESTDVITWRGSPARVFVPSVSCALEG